MEGSGEQARRNEALEGLFRRRYARMVSLAWLLVGSTPEAEQVVQDAFASITEAWPRVRSPDAYLRGSVVNGSRRSYRRLRSVLVAQVDDRPAADEADDDKPSQLLALPERQRSVVVLRFYEDLSIAEIAALMKCPQATVRSLLRRGLRRMEVELEASNRA